MTAETLKPFLSPPNVLGALPAACHEKKSLKTILFVCGSVMLLVLFVSVTGLEIWNANKIDDLQQEMANLKQQLADNAESFELKILELRNLHRLDHLQDFSDFEQAYDTNEIHANSDEYEEAPYDDDNIEGEEEGSTNEFGIPDYVGDDIETEISVTATNNVVDGKRKARSISGMTFQGVPILDESYMSRHNRSRQHQPHHQRHHPQYQQLRQRPEETASPPPQLKLKWDDENREIPPHHQQQQSVTDAGRHSGTRRLHHRYSTTTTKTTTASNYSPVPSYVRRNEFGRSEKFVESLQPNKLAADYTTKPPGPTHNRHSRVMMTNGENKYQKVIKNPGTYMESRQPPAQRVGRLMRKSVPAPRVTALHLVKNHSHISEHKATDHSRWLWHAADTANAEALRSGGVFHLNHRGVLTVNDSGVYFLYAQITYMDPSLNSGFSIVVNGRKHASCSVHGQHNEKANTCYTAALVDLENNSQIEIRDMDSRRAYLPYHEKSFFGLYKLGRRPVAVPASYA